MIVVSNTSSLTNLAAVGHLSLLAQIYGHIHIPEEVSLELSTVQPDHSGHIAVSEVSWITVKPLESQMFARTLLRELDPGEAAAIALALELHADVLLIDERKGRKVATRLGLERVGLLGILKRAKLDGHILEVKPILDHLIEFAGFWVSDSLYAQVLQEMNESPV